MTLHSSSIASIVRSHQSVIQAALFTAVEGSIVGNDELAFINALVPQLDLALTTSLAGLGLTAKTRSAKVHGRPTVSYIDGRGKSQRCELADILFVVKYPRPDGTYEARYVLLQAKCATTPSTTTCSIDQVQLELLRKWPSFSFGTSPYAVGPPGRASLSEFGSYILMQRRPSLGGMLVPLGSPVSRKCYGWLTTADLIFASGPKSVNFSALTSHSCPDAMLFEQVAFSYGESESAPGVKLLVGALYRYVGLAPDPPDEFNGSIGEEGTFAILELSVSGQ